MQQQIEARFIRRKGRQSMTPPNQVEALLFDMGGVVIEIDFDLAIQRWATQSRLSVEEVRSRFSMDTAYERHERGEIDASEYFEHLRNQLELDASDEEITAGWNAIYVGEISESIGHVAIAKEQLPCYLFTNSNPTHQVAWLAIFPEMIATFDEVFVSSEMGVRKPERAAVAAIAGASGGEYRELERWAELAHVLRPLPVLVREQQRLGAEIRHVLWLLLLTVLLTAEWILRQRSGML